jgi:hypothetical protein
MYGISKGQKSGWKNWNGNIGNGNGTVKGKN